MAEVNSDYEQAKNAFKKRADDIDRIKNNFINSYSDYVNDADNKKVTVTLLSISSALLALLSPFICNLIVNAVEESPFYTVLLTIAFLSISAYMALHAAKNRVILNRTNSINAYITQLDSLKNNLKENLNKKSYTANSVDVDAELSKLKNISNNLSYEDNDLLNGSYIKIVYWASSIAMMIGTGGLFAKVILGALLQEHTGWLIFCSLLYFTASAAALWAVYHFWLNEYDFMYTTGSYIFNILFQTLFTVLLLCLWPVALIALALVIVIAVLSIFGG